jgi:predicted small secreted protein
MKRALLLGLILGSMVLAACGSAASGAPADMPQALRVTDGTKETSYTVADLQKLDATEATFNEVTYKGVVLSALLADTGFDAGALRAVKASAADGYSVNYDPALFQRQDVLVAYATVDGPLAEEDGAFRMVLPGEEGKLNVRMLSELKVTP